jgi:hypothetical protein
MCSVPSNVADLDPHSIRPLNPDPASECRSRSSSLENYDLKLKYTMMGNFSVNLTVKLFYLAKLL